MNTLKDCSKKEVSPDLKTTDYIISGPMTNKENLLKHWGAEFINGNWMLLNSNESAPDFLGIQSLGFSLTAIREKVIQQSLTCPECEGDEHHCTHYGCQQQPEENEVKKRYVIQGPGTFGIKAELDANLCKWDKERKAWITPELAPIDLRFKQLKSLANLADAEFYPLDLDGQQKTVRDILNKGRK